jgi:phosphoribosylanthranilate isomerase
VVKVKICGIRRLDEAQAALEYGADFLGFVFYPPSGRYLTPDDAARLIAKIRGAVARQDWAAVGVFVNEPADFVKDVAERCGLDYVQLHGTEPPAYCALMQRPVIKAVRLAEMDGGPVSAASFGATRLILDSQVPGYWGGTGKRFDWAGARRYAAEALVAGGLTPDNVAEALEVLRPWGVDVSSGVERNGLKDPDLIRSFLARAREYARNHAG